MDGHFLIKMTYMLHWICPAIIKRESWLVKSPRKASTLNPSCERWFGYLTQGLVHSFVSQALMRGTFALPPIITVFFTTGEGFTRWSFRSLHICIIFCIPRRGLRLKWCPFTPRRRNFFFNSSISCCMSFSFSAWDAWLPPRDWLLLMCTICPLCSRPPLCWGWTPE